uniref:Uncharacterized protein n=1 Tax=Oryza nivara TaxID=4536 RepID=A0A0E0H207_ORYNI
MTMTTATLDPPPPPLLIAGSLLDDDRDAGSAASSSPRWLPWARGSTVGSPPRRGGEERGGEAATRRKGNSSSPDDDDDCRNDEDDCRNDYDYRDDDVGATTDGGGDTAALLPMAMTTATTMAPMPVEAAADGGGELSSAGEGGQRRVNLLPAKILSAYENHLFSQALACRWNACPPRKMDLAPHLLQLMWHKALPPYRSFLVFGAHHLSLKNPCALFRLRLWSLWPLPIWEDEWIIEKLAVLAARRIKELHPREEREWEEREREE